MLYRNDGNRFSQRPPRNAGHETRVARAPSACVSRETGSHVRPHAPARGRRRRPPEARLDPEQIGDAPEQRPEHGSGHRRPERRPDRLAAPLGRRRHRQPGERAANVGELAAPWRTRDAARRMALSAIGNMTLAIARTTSPPSTVGLWPIRMAISPPRDPPTIAPAPNAPRSRPACDLGEVVLLDVSRDERRHRAEQQRVDEHRRRDEEGEPPHRRGYAHAKMHRAGGRLVRPSD